MSLPWRPRGSKGCAALMWSPFTSLRRMLDVWRPPLGPLRFGWCLASPRLALRHHRDLCAGASAAGVHGVTAGICAPCGLRRSRRRLHRTSTAAASRQGRRRAGRTRYRCRRIQRAGTDDACREETHRLIVANLLPAPVPYDSRQTRDNSRQGRRARLRRPSWQPSLSRRRRAAAVWRTRRPSVPVGPPPPA